MNSAHRTFHGREWALFGVKWLLIIMAAAALYLTRPAGTLDLNGDLVLALAVAAIANFIVAVMLLLPVFQPSVAPVIVAGDVIMVAAFLRLTTNDPTLTLALVLAFQASALVALSPLWSGLQAGLLLVAFIAVQALTVGTDLLLPTLTGSFVVVLLAAVVMALVVPIGALALDRVVGVQQRTIQQLREGETKALDNLRERTRALYEVATDFNTTLNFRKILTAALDIGKFGLREEVVNRGFVGAVLLFRQDDGGLHVVGGRRLTRADERVIVYGMGGIIGRTLSEAMPVFGKDASKDPELQYFAGFTYCKSLLCIPLRSGYNTYGVLVYGSEAEDAFDEDLSELLEATGTQATIALHNAMLYHNLQEQKMRIVDVEEDARKKLARDLHDGPTQSIAAIAMRMAIIQKMLQKAPDQVPDELNKVEELARRTTKEIRHMLFTLRPLVLESQGLKAALDQLAEKMYDLHKQYVTVHVEVGVEDALDAHQQNVLFAVAEEAVNNARKHAHADTISVRLLRQPDCVVCEIADNGVGFDAAKINANYERRGSLGMINMRERVALLDGTLQIDSEPGQGTTITVVTPLQDPLSVPTVGGVKLSRLTPIAPHVNGRR